MPKSCSAYNCTNRYSSKNPDLTFHRFPLSKPTVLKEWLHNIARDDFQPNRHMVLCSQHFTPDCFNSYGNRKNLLWNAVPTVFSFPPLSSKARLACGPFLVIPRSVAPRSGECHCFTVRHVTNAPIRSPGLTHRECLHENTAATDWSAPPSQYRCL
ncbi:THAP3 protein, partial [Amia calva]|nr:THAP3 protein [Amia calva]